MSRRQVEFPEKLLPLLNTPCRYKVIYGGRGSGKSWTVARMLVLLAASKTLRVLCARETQKSIQESVHRLLKDQIGLLGLEDAFEIQETRILGRNGSEFTFAGIRQQGVANMKSYEGVDIVWVEEAQVVTQRSWDILVPTIRKPGSEIWLTFNPELESDETYTRFVLHPPEGAMVIRCNWSDNPWFPAELEKERQEWLKRDPVGYETVWEGKCRAAVQGAIYAAEIDRMTAEGRIGKVAYEQSLPVHTFWDLGVGDSTAIWFAQQAGNEVRLIDYYEASGEGLPHYARVLQERGYVYGHHYAPHDIQVRELGSGLSRVEVAANLGIRFDVVPMLGLEDGIHALRMLFPRMWIDKEKCRRGLDCLRSYRWDYNEKMGEFKSRPVHDAASHAADAARYLAVALRKDSPRADARDYAGASWMA